MSKFLGKFFQRFLKTAQEELFGDCLLCGLASKTLICSSCERLLPSCPDTVCKRCGASLRQAGVCASCLLFPPAFDEVRAAFWYLWPVTALTSALKYSADWGAGEVLAQGLNLRARASASDVDALVPMPLHPKKLRQRGYNQSLEIAKSLSQKLHMPLLAQGLARVRHTPSQTTLSAKERKANVARAFAPLQDFSGMKVALVDDVMTTGATLEEAARALKKGGALKVAAWVAARDL